MVEGLIELDALTEGVAVMLAVTDVEGVHAEATSTQQV